MFELIKATTLVPNAVKYCQHHKVKHREAKQTYNVMKVVQVSFSDAFAKENAVMVKFFDTNSTYTAVSNFGCYWNLTILAYQILFRIISFCFTCRQNWIKYFRTYARVAENYFN